MTNPFENAPLISSYSRAQALADGVLYDCTEWASAEKGFIGGFRYPVALTSAAWCLITDIPPRLAGWNDIRGRAHDVLWMASLAARRAVAGTSSQLFRVILPTSGRGGQAHKIFKLCIGPGDAGEPVVTIMLPSES